MERESGYYWVKIKGEWIVAQWDKSMDWWVITGNEHLFYDSDFEEIDERRIVRVKHFENFIIEPYVPEISPYTDEEKEKLDNAVMQLIKDELEIDVKCEGLINDIKSCVPLMRNPPPPPNKKNNG